MGVVWPTVHIAEFYLKSPLAQALETEISTDPKVAEL